MTDLFVPGRLCLFGEHSDWAGGYRVTHPTIPPGVCLVTGTTQGLTATIEVAPGLVEFTSVDADGKTHGPQRWPVDVTTLDAAARAGGFFAYAAGTAAEMIARHGCDGVRVHVTQTTLPVGKGLSSSAAVCVLVARAFGRLYDLDLGPEDEMRLAYAGERRAGSACGQMDQVCAFGQRTLRLEFDGPGFSVSPVRVGGSITLVVADLRRGKDTRRILADLNACYPDVEGPIAARVREALGTRNHALIAAAESALAAGDVQTLGAIMREAQDVFDAFVAPACSELVAPRMHEILADEGVRAMTYGGKGVGSQGDGCVQFVVRNGIEPRRLIDHLGGRLGADAFAMIVSG